MRYFFAAVCFAAWFAFSFSASAQDPSEYIQVSAAPNWVEVLPAPMGEFTPGRDLKVGYRIVDHQFKIDPLNEVRYRRFYMDLNNPQALEDEGTISITFDPSFQTVNIHTIDIVRDGQVIDKIEPAAFNVFSVETETDKLLYNGDLKFSFAVTDLRVGDSLDYSYSIEGRNPAYKESYFVRRAQAFSLPIENFQLRVLIEKSLPVFSRAFNEAILPEPTTSREYNVYTVVKQNIPVLVIDDDSPNWYYSAPTVEYSNFETWADVGRRDEAYYALTDADRKAVSDIVADIKTESEAPEAQAKLALKYVQRNIRYLGVELGEGGFIPRRPAKTLSQRFGDCKDVTLLLMAILEGLDIHAFPVLVNTSELENFILAQPNPYAFDHVVAGAVIDEKSYFLDATRSEQLGDLLRLDQGVYGKGLKVLPGASGVIDMLPTVYEWRKDFTDVFDIVSDPEKISFTTTARYFGEDADSTLAWYRNIGLAEVEKVYLDYYKDFFPSIEQVKPTVISIDEKTSQLAFVSYYEIPNPWTVYEDENLKKFSTVPYELRAEMPKFSGADRTAPMVIAYPKKIRHTIHFNVDDGWSFENSSQKVDRDAFTYTYDAAFKDNVYSEVYTYEAKKDHISAESFADEMASIKSIRDGLDTTLQDVLDREAEMSSWSEETWMAVFSGSSVFLSLIAAIFAIFIKDYDAAWRDELILHPVSLKKFLILTIATIGAYQIFWFYKNWQWYRTVEKEDIQPAIRSFFSGIMNFSLFTRISDQSDTGYKWFSFVAVPIAMLYFVGGVIDRMIIGLPALPDWLSLLSLGAIFLVVPVAMQVNKYNSDKPEMIAKNSRFTWRTFGLIAMFFPIATMAWLGFAIIAFEAIFGTQLT